MQGDTSEHVAASEGLLGAFEFNQPRCRRIPPTTAGLTHACRKDTNIQVIGVGGGGPGDGDSGSDGDSKPKVREVQSTFSFAHLEEWKNAIYAKMVKKVGDRAYWATWAADIARIAEKHITRIKALVKDKNAPYAKDFAKFLKSLQDSLNPAVTADEAVEMLAQHLITQPVFDALFAHYAFTEHNPVSQSMQAMLNKLEEQAVSKEAETLDKFYASVRDRASTLDNAEARQKVIYELYEEFFKNAFKDLHERLGIVYTPVEVVDFIIHSVQDVLRNEFDSGLGEKDVHIIDPFTGTGTFLVRLLQSGLIPPENLLHKYQHELHANEIVLLAYYIAAINIEETFHGIRGDSSPKKGEDGYLPFEGICLTDTFQLYESGQLELEGTFPENNKRVKRQKECPIRVVIANPPYSALQERENDNNPNLDYPSLDNRITQTYVARSSATLKTSLYDSYIRAIRWASDRIEGRGIIGIVTNGAYIDGNAAGGLRACLTEEFSSVYLFNLRGNARTQGEQRRAEAGNVFGAGTRTPVAITLLVKNPAAKCGCAVRYYDIGDYLDRTEKLKIIRALGSIAGIEHSNRWKTIKPNENHDWINQRDPAFASFQPLAPADSGGEISYFAECFGGVKSNRDAWVYNFSITRLIDSVKSTIAFYNAQRGAFHARSAKATAPLSEQISKFIDTDPKKISWTVNLKADLGRNRDRKFHKNAIAVSIYRPFSKLRWYGDPGLNERGASSHRLLPTPNTTNLIICVTGPGAAKDFSALLVSDIPNYHAHDTGQCFPLYLYDPADQEEQGALAFDGDGDTVIDGYRRRDAVTDEILIKFKEAYGPKVTKEDIFYYVYGVLHSPEYRSRFAADLKKMLPRIPPTKETKDFESFSAAGRKLAEWHLNYETVQPWPVKEHCDQLDLGSEDIYKIQKMFFARPSAEQKAAGLKWDRTRIIYNNHVTISKIPLEAYEYVLNGKPAIEWVMERYQVTRDKDSGIVNDPNDWCKEHKQPRYILDLIGRIVRVSMETMKIVNGLPPLNEQGLRKQYRESTKAIVEGAKRFAEEKRKRGWTRDDATASLKKMLESDTGDDE